MTLNVRAFTAWLRAWIRWGRLVWLMRRYKPVYLDNFGIPASAVQQRIAELEADDGG